MPTLGGERLGRMLRSVAGGDAQVIVIDNGSGDGVARTCEGLEGVEVVRLAENVGYTRAVNLGVARADGEVVVLLNDDCVCDPGFVERITAPIDAAAGVVMAAGVMRDWHDPTLIDSAGMELDRTLLVFDYLNGEPLSRLRDGVADPVGPSAAAAAFDRSTFLSVGGFDERLFAYWEDVDLVVRLRRLGFRCALAARRDRRPRALGHPGLGLGAQELPDGLRARLRAPQVAGGQRPPAGAGARPRGRALRRAGARRSQRRRCPRPDPRLPQRGRARALPGRASASTVASSAAETLRRRARRRSRLRSRPTRSGLRSLAVFHLADTSGPSRSLEAELAWLGEQGALDVVIPGPGHVGEVLGDAGGVIQLDYEALTKPAPGARGLWLELRRLLRDVRAFRRLIRERRPELVLSVTTMLPAVPIAARLERVPALVYCGELFDRGFRGGPVRALASRALAVLTARLAAVIIACSDTVAGQFMDASAKVETVYPPVGERYAHGDGTRASSAARDRPGGAGARLGRLPDRGPGPGRARTGDAGDPRCGCRRHATCSPAIRSPARRTSPTASGWWPWSTELGLGDSVIVAGHVEEIADVYAAADVVVNPARFNEPFGRVPFEAAVAGRPAVVTRVGAIPELLVDGHSALIVEPEDPEGLADAVVRVLADPALGARLVAGAREIVATRLTPAHSLAGFQRAVDETLAETVAEDASGGGGVDADDPLRQVGVVLGVAPGAQGEAAAPGEPAQQPGLAAAGVVAGEAAQLPGREPGARRRGSGRAPGPGASTRRRGARARVRGAARARPRSAPCGSTRRSRSAATRPAGAPARVRAAPPAAAARRRRRRRRWRPRGRSPPPGAGRSRRAGGRRRRSGRSTRRPAPASGRGRGCRPAAAAAAPGRAARGERAPRPR